MADKPFTIIGVNSDQEIGKKTLDEIRAVSKKKSLTWRSFQNTDPEVKISTTWNVKGWPTTYLIDHEGKIRYKNLRGNALDEALEKLMDEMGHEVSLVGVDHEAEDEEAMEAEKERAKKDAEESDASSEEEPDKDSDTDSTDKTSDKDAAEKTPESKKADVKADASKEVSKDGTQASDEKAAKVKAADKKADGK